MQILERTEAKTKKKGAKADGPGEALLADETHRGTHWREDKIAKYMTMQSLEREYDPCPDVLEVFVNPARILKLTRELKVKKAAAGEANRECLSETPSEQEADRVLGEE